MNDKDIVKQHFTESIQTKISTADSMSDQICQAGNILLQTLISGNKIFICGNGALSSESQGFSEKMINRFNIERPPLPVIDLTANSSIITAISRDYQHDSIYSKQLYALSTEQDTLITMSTTGHSKNIISAIKVAKEKSLNIIALTGKNPGDISDSLQGNDIIIKIESDKNCRIQENHSLILNCFCELIEQKLFGI